MSRSQHPAFDCRRLHLWALCRRDHDLHHALCHPLVPPITLFANQGIPQLADRILSVCSRSLPVILMLGAHPIKLGLSRFLIDLIERRFITHLATNGAGLVHDFELALVGGTSEDVARWIKVGQFGLWQETSRLNDIASEAAQRDEGLGEAAGRIIEEENFPHRDLSLAAACWRTGIPFTVHVSIGCDIVHAMPNCDGAAWGQASYTDFLIFAHSVSQLEGGVFLNVGSAVTGPEVYLKALSMARNVARQEGREIRHFTTAVFDLAPLPGNWREGPPSKEEPLYYYRPWKTILCRTVADGGQSFYIQGDHRQTIPALWQALVEGSESASSSSSSAEPVA
jgi:hypothetical protein